ncbi:MAG: sugar ABC transporter ATP-binding protein [Planctomycetaceae bacterium]
MPTPVLSLQGISKSFRGVAALKPLSLHLSEGEILGLVGENGAGKSTLIKILSGVHEPDSGEIVWSGRPVRFRSPAQAISAGIATIHQELEYFGRLTVAENMLFGEAWPRVWWKGVDWKQLHTIARQRLADFGIEIDPASMFDELTAAEKQEVAIASALARDARLLILDEPTASLSEPEVQRLFSHLRRLQQRGIAMIYVSHRLDEIFAITDRVAVLRDGALVSGTATREVDVGQLVGKMVGRPLDQVYPHTRTRSAGEPLLALANATRAGMFENVSLEVRAGEIVGLAGLVGAGRSEIARAIFGMYPLDSGSMSLLGKPWMPDDSHAALRAGLIYLPEERKRQGLVLDHSLSDSLTIGFNDLMARFGLVNERRQESRVLEILKTFDIRATGPEQVIGSLSGGNQQKALLARWLERDPSVIILDEPTRGVDVGAKAQIHAVVDRLADKGRGILFISSDLPEVLGMCDRVLVMNRGCIAAELSGEAMTEHHLLLAASGMLPEPAVR